MTTTDTPRIEALPGVPASQLGESPCWHPTQHVLYWCDIVGHALHRFDPATQRHESWAFDTDLACCAPLTVHGRIESDLMLLALRSGLAIFDTTSGRLEPLLDTRPYDPAVERYNDGKADPQGRMWVGHMDETRQRASGALHRFDERGLVTMAGDATIANGLAWSPDARTMYWADTTTGRVDAFDYDLDEGSIANRRAFARFPAKQPGQDITTYGGRPDGAAVDVEGFYWLAMYEGARLLRLAPDGRVDREVRLPVRCPTMPCFGDADRRTLYVSSARHGRPADELEREPLAGCVLRLRVDVAGLPCNLARL